MIPRSPLAYTRSPSVAAMLAPRTMRGYSTTFREVSKALGHGNVNTTARYYDRHVERKFASLPTADVGAPLPDGKMIGFPTRKTA